MANVSMSPEQLHQLVTSLTAAAIQAAAGGVAPSTASFANVSFSYDGTRESIRLEEFLSAASVYKKVNSMTDEAAIMSLPLVLKGEASTWWQGVKNSITLWTDFEARVRHAFAPRISGVQVFQEVFARKQPPDMLTETFIAKNRALLSQLRSPGMTEELQIDAIHGQLHIDLRERIPRDSVTTFDQLLTAARNVEQTLREKSSSVLSIDNSGKQAGQFKKKPRCDYCRATGHTFDECRTKLKQMGEGYHPPNEIKTESTPAPSPSTPTLYCYGCGMPGYTRSKCPKCKDAQPIKMEGTGLCTLDINFDARPRVQVGISIHDIIGTALIDPGAKSSVASYQLYKCLKERQCSFAKQTANVAMADGLKRKEEVLSITVPVKVSDRVIPTTFVVLPHTKENKTLLGMGFIEDAGMVINIPQRSWNFVDRPHTYYDFTMEEPDGVTMAQFEPDLYPGAAPRYTKPVYESEPNVAAVATQHNPGPVKRPHQVFDGYSPEPHDMEYKCAVRSIEETEVVLSPNSQAPFTGYMAEDIELFALEVGKVKMGPVNDEQKRHKERVIMKSEEAPSASTSSAPVVLLPKKDGSLHPCIDYKTVPVLREPDETKPYLIKADASNNAIGAILVQGEGEDEHPVEFASGLLNSAQGVRNELMPRRDGSYIVQSKQGATTTYKLAKPSEPEKTVGTYHTSDLTSFKRDDQIVPEPLQPIREKEKPGKATYRGYAQIKINLTSYPARRGAFTDRGGVCNTNCLAQQTMTTTNAIQKRVE